MFPDWALRQVARTASQAASYARAEASLVLEGPASPETQEARREACRACPEREAVEGDPLGFCRACGCGRNPRARLTVKLTMPKATCPRNLWPTPTVQ